MKQSEERYAGELLIGSANEGHDGCAGESTWQATRFKGIFADC
jgi:hypothetical protein